MKEKVLNQIKWWSYKRGVYERWRLWDSLGGGKNAAKQIAPFRLLSRPSFNPIAANDPMRDDPHYRQAMPAYNNRAHQDIVCHIPTPCYIDPEFGYTIMEPAVLIPESLAWSHFARTKELLHYFSGVPFYEEYQEARLGRRPVRSEPIVVSLRHVFDLNYGHCLIQLLPAVLLLEECGVSADIPIVVSSRLGNLPFFQEIIQRGILKKRRWIVQEEAYIHAQEVIFAVMEWPSHDLLNRFLDGIEAPPGEESAQRRLFMLRKSRQLSNREALQPILDQFGFESIRPEEFTVAQQMKIFSQAGVVCGVLGAALTNVIFRRNASLHLLEIQSCQEKDVFFYNLAKTCGYPHRSLIGGPYETRDRYSNFTVEPERFEAFLREALALEPSGQLRAVTK